MSSNWSNSSALVMDKCSVISHNVIISPHNNYSMVVLLLSWPLLLMLTLLIGVWSTLIEIKPRNSLLLVPNWNWHSQAPMNYCWCGEVRLHLGFQSNLANIGWQSFFWPRAPSNNSPGVRHGQGAKVVIVRKLGLAVLPGPPFVMHHRC